MSRTPLAFTVADATALPVTRARLCRSTCRGPAPARTCRAAQPDGLALGHRNLQALQADARPAKAAPAAPAVGAAEAPAEAAPLAEQIGPACCPERPRPQRP